jgi:Putative addiction module component
MKELTITFPEEIYDSVVSLLKQIPNVTLDENESIPEWHKKILDERFKQFNENPLEGIPLKEAKKRLFSNG